MAQQVALGAVLQCSFGAAPASLVVTDPRVIAEGKLAANIMDYVPMTNIPSFGMCSSIANPAVASATASASGVLTPQACVPVVPAPWAPGSPTVLVRGMPALNNTSKCACTWGGVIQIQMASTTTEMVP
jgi:hypothetical protein